LKRDDGKGASYLVDDPSPADRNQRKYLNHIRRNPGPYTDPDATGPEFLEQFDKFKVL
jgi:ubiquitin-activating enzyme E1 C